MTEPVSCIWCETTHQADLLCEPAAAALNAIIQGKLRRDVATEMFDEPRDEATPEDTILVGQLTIKGALVEVAGVRRACLLFSGLDVHDKPLPTWLYASTDADVESIGNLAQTMASGAVRARRRERNR